MLKVLDLSLNVVSKEGAEALIMGKWPLLERLSITMSCLNVETLRVILKDCMPLLSVLHISGCPLTMSHQGQMQGVAFERLGGV